MHLSNAKLTEAERVRMERAEIWNDGTIDRMIDLKEQWQGRLTRARTMSEAMRCLRRILELEHHAQTLTDGLDII